MLELTLPVERWFDTTEGSNHSYIMHFPEQIGI